MNSPAILDLEDFCSTLQSLNRALATADTQAIFTLVSEIGEKTRKLEQLELAMLNPAEAQQARTLATRIRRIQEMNQAMSNSGLRTIRWCAQLLQPAASYAADGTLPQAAAGINLSV